MITTVIRRGSTVTAYDERNSPIFSRPIGSRSTDGLHGYTDHSVSVRQGGSVFTYNEKGQPISSRPC